MSYEKDKIDSFVTSASLSTVLAQYVTSNSLSAAVAGLDLSAYVSSNSLSSAVATDTLTVRGAASVSATMAASAVTVGGYPVGSVVLGYQAVTGTGTVGFSGSWSDYPILELVTTYLMSGTATASFLVFTDGGTTPVLSSSPTALIFGPKLVEFNGRFMGNGTDQKYIYATWRRTQDFISTAIFSSTANAGFVNCIRMSQSRTMSAGFALLIGYRKA